MKNRKKKSWLGIIGVVVTGIVLSVPSTLNSTTKKPIIPLPPGTSWQWQLSGIIDTSFDVQMYDIDLFNTDQSVIDQLHNDGRIVICYFCGGSWEDWRPDAGQFPDSSDLKIASSTFWLFRASSGGVGTSFPSRNALENSSNSIPYIFAGPRLSSRVPLVFITVIRTGTSG